MFGYVTMTATPLMKGYRKQTIIRCLKKKPEKTFSR